jgi:cytochrome b561
MSRSDCAAAPQWSAGWKDPAHLLIHAGALQSMFDKSGTYGLVTKFFHWAIALLILWELAGGIARSILGRDNEIVRTMFSWHAQIGIAILISVMMRSAWRTLNIVRGPRLPAADLAGRMARFGHLAMYAGMIAIPATGLLLIWGRARNFSPFGFPIFREGEATETMKLIASVAKDGHVYLSWTILALIAGHIATAFYHHFGLRDGTLRKMI